MASSATIPQLDRLRSPQRAAAQAALEQITAKQQGAPAAEHVAAWVDALWSDRGVGTIDPETAVRTLEAFCNREPLPQAAVLGTGVLKAGPGGMQIRSAQRDDGADWKDAVDLRNVGPRLVALDADIAWLLSLDLRDPAQFTQFGQWAGWANPKEQCAAGSSWTSDTVQHFLLNELSRRHNVPHAVARPYIDAALTDDASQRSLQGDMFGAIAAKFAKTAFVREAKFDAFLLAMPQIQERIQSGRVDEADVRHDLEDQLGLPRATIGPGDFALMRDEMSWDRGDLSSEAHVQNRKRMGYVQSFYIGHVRGEATANGMADKMIALGLLDKLKSGALDDDGVLAAIATSYGVPIAGIDPAIYERAKNLVPKFIAAHRS